MVPSITIYYKQFNQTFVYIQLNVKKFYIKQFNLAYVNQTSVMCLHSV